MFRKGVGGATSRHCRDCVSARKADRLAKKKARKGQLGSYPKAGFQNQRSQLALVERQCCVCLITDSQHKKKYNADLQLHHVILARLAQQFGDPHAEYNQAWLCNEDHPKMRNADIALQQNDWLEWVAANKRAGLPDDVMRRALSGYRISWKRLPL